MRKAYLLVFFSLLFITLVSAVPPVTTEFVGSEGFSIQANIQNYYKINEGACTQIFVFNRSNGAILSDGISCKVWLVDHNGTEVLTGDPTLHTNHFDMCRPENVVTEREIYALTIVCNDSILAGEKTAFFEANDNGKEPPAGGVHVFLMILGIATLLFILYTLLKTLKDISTVNVNLNTISLAFSAYFVNLAFYYYLLLFMPMGLMLDLSLLSISAFGVTHIILPLIGLIFSWIKKGSVE